MGCASSQHAAEDDVRCCRCFLWQLCNVPPPPGVRSTTRTTANLPPVTTGQTLADPLMLCACSPYTRTLQHPTKAPACLPQGASKVPVPEEVVAIVPDKIIPSDAAVAVDVVRHPVPPSREAAARVRRSAAPGVPGHSIKRAHGVPSGVACTSLPLWMPQRLSCAMLNVLAHSLLTSRLSDTHLTYPMPPLCPRYALPS